MASAMPIGFVFGYGSLTNRAEDRTVRDASVARLPGFRRVWNVAMDNSVSIPGYKHYLDPRSGERPAVFVTYLNIEPAAGVSCVGALLPVDANDLSRLDRRELNYRRIDVTELVERTAADPSLPVWTYLGLDAALARHRQGLAAGTAVVQREYLETVERGFGELGLIDQFRTGTVPPACPVRSLKLVRD
jgi:cation transport regulator ChaC